MQNNVTELTQKLLRSVDNSYNVIDMPVVMEIITVLERMPITKELLEATRLGKHINELRRKATTESLQKRTKELVKRWRRLLFPGSNGQLAGTAAKPTEDVNLNQVRKRPASDKLEPGGTKRSRVNGTTELDFSDNSNSSFKDCVKSEPERVILINSDSNSSFHDAKQDPVLELQNSKKRGRKKGSKNHRSLLDEAETSFTNKMAVSRGNAKVKTTQELVASLQNRGTTPTTPNNNASTSTLRPLDNLSERAAKLTERVSIIDQKLNTNANRKNAQKKLVKNSNSDTKNDRVIESGIVVNITNARTTSTGDDEIIVVDEPEQEPVKNEVLEEEEETIQEAVNEVELPKSYSIEEALALLPPIDLGCLDEVEEPEPSCTCILKERKSLFSLEEDDDDSETRFIEDCNCQARKYLADKYRLDLADEQHAKALNDTYLPGINGNYGLGVDDRVPVMTEDGLFENIVPNVAREGLAKQCDASDFVGENYKRYSISDGTPGDGAPKETFREFHEVLERPSYNDEPFTILPYVIID